MTRRPPKTLFVKLTFFYCASIFFLFLEESGVTLRRFTLAAKGIENIGVPFRVFDSGKKRSHYVCRFQLAARNVIISFAVSDSGELS